MTDIFYAPVNARSNTNGTSRIRALDNHVLGHIHDCLVQRGWNHVMGIMIFRTSSQDNIQSADMSVPRLRSRFKGRGVCRLCRANRVYESNMCTHLGRCGAVDNFMQDLQARRTNSAPLYGEGGTDPMAARQSRPSAMRQTYFPQGTGMRRQCRVYTSRPSHLAPMSTQSLGPSIPPAVEEGRGGTQNTSSSQDPGALSDFSGIDMDWDEGFECMMDEAARAQYDDAMRPRRI